MADRKRISQRLGLGLVPGEAGPTGDGGASPTPPPPPGRAPGAKPTPPAERPRPEFPESPALPARPAPASARGEAPLKGQDLPPGMSDLRSLLDRVATRIPRTVQPTRGAGPRPETRGFEEHYFRIRAEGEYAHAYLSPDYAECPRCKGEGYVYLEEGGYELLHGCPRCAELRRRIDLYNQARVPRLYAQKSLESFEPTNEATGRAREFLLNYVRSTDSGKQGVLLVGPPGVGKTHLLCGVVQHLTLERGRACLFKDFFLLLGELREAYDKGSATHILKPLGEIDVLVVDELGKGRLRDWEISLLDEIVCKRYNKGKVTLFTTNFPLEAKRGAEVEPDDGFKPWMQKKKERSAASFRGVSGRPGGDILEDRVSDRVLSRLMEMCVILPLETSDFRPQRGPDQPFRRG